MLKVKPKPQWMVPIIVCIRREKKDIFKSYNLFLNEQKKLTNTMPPLFILFIHIYKPSPSLDLKRSTIDLFGKGGMWYAFEKGTLKLEGSNTLTRDIKFEG